MYYNNITKGEMKPFDFTFDDPKCPVSIQSMTSVSQVEDEHSSQGHGMFSKLAIPKEAREQEAESIKGIVSSIQPFAHTTCIICSHSKLLMFVAIRCASVLMRIPFAVES